MKNLIKSLGSAFWNALYPPHCLHCERSLDVPHILCPPCSSHLELIDPAGRCRYCFASEGVSARWNICGNCRREPLPLNGFAAAFDDIGPAHDLLRAFRSGKNYFSESLCGYMYLQYLNLNWPQPDLIVPVAGSFSRWLKQGYHPSVLLAKEMGKYLQCPVLNLLKRDSYHTEEPQFSLKTSADVGDKIVLLIDDWYHSREMIAKVSVALRAGAPEKIYAIAVTRKME